MLFLASKCPYCGGELVSAENLRKARCLNCGRVYITYRKVTLKTLEAKKAAELLRKGDTDGAVRMIEQHFGSFLEFFKTLVLLHMVE